MVSGMRDKQTRYTANKIDWPYPSGLATGKMKKSKNSIMSRLDLFLVSWLMKCAAVDGLIHSVGPPFNLFKALCASFYTFILVQNLNILQSVLHIAVSGGLIPPSCVDSWKNELVHSLLRNSSNATMNMKRTSFDENGRLVVGLPRSNFHDLWSLEVFKMRRITRTILCCIKSRQSP